MSAKARSKLSRVRRRVPWKVTAVVLFAVAALLAGLVWWHDRPYQRALAAMQGGDLENARLHVSRFLADHPRDSRGLALYGRLLVANGRPEESLRVFAEAGAAEAEDIHAWARAHMMLGEWSKALPMLIRVLELNPDGSDALYELTSCRLRLGMFDDARASAQRFASIPGNEARGLLFLATIESDRGNDAQAAQHFAEVLKHDPDARNLQVTADEFFLQFGRALLATGKPQECLEPLKRSVAIRPLGEGFVLLGNAAQQLGRVDRAVQAWQQALIVEPGNREAREALANHALQKGDAQQSLKLLEPLKNHPQLMASTAYLFQRTFGILNDTTQAKQWQEKANKLREDEKVRAAVHHVLVETPNSFWARVIRAHRFATQGNWSEADSLLATVVREAPDDPFVKDLNQAVKVRGALPSLDRLPLKQF